MSKLRIAVYFGTRADMSPLLPLLTAIESSPDLELLLVSHGSADQVRQLARAQPRTAVIELPRRSAGDRLTDILSDLAAITEGVGVELSAQAADMLIVLGDRWELLGVAGSAMLAGVPIGHIHGGEITEGALDERVRHAITKLSDIHFCATEKSASRVLLMGEDPARVIVSGAPGLDRFSDTSTLPVAQLESVVGTTLVPPVAVVTYHPATADGHADRGAGETLRAAAHTCGSVVVTRPGPDPGHGQVVEEIERAVANHANVIYFPDLLDSYQIAMRTANLMVGNSSSGIIEAASFGLAVVNVGDRQKGRERGENVIDCAENQAEIERAIQRAVSPEFQALARAATNPYGDGRAAKRIVDAILTFDLTSFHRKPFFYHGAPY